MTPRGTWTRRAIHLGFALGLAAIVLFARDLRSVRVPAMVAFEGTPEETWYIDDPDAAYHLRRVEIAMATGAVPAFDRMIAHPEGSAVPWPRFFDWALALYAEARVGDIGSLGPTAEAERRTEAVLARVPPWLGAFTCVLVALAAATFVRRVQPHAGARGRGFVLAPALAGLVAAFVYATTPIAIWYADAGRIDHHVAIALLFAANLAVMAQVFKCGRFESDRTQCEASALDATVGGLLGGAIAGFALLTWLASALFVALAGVSFWLAGTALRADRAANARRAGSLYFATAALITFVPAISSPWNETQAWSLVNLTLGVPVALILAAVALGLPALLPARLDDALHLCARTRALALVVPPLVGGLAYVFLPGFGEGVQEGLAWASRANLFMDVVDESRPLIELGGGSLWAGLRTDLGWAGLALPVVALWIGANVSLSFDRTRGGARPEARFHLLLCLVVFGYLAIEQRRFGNSLAVPLSCAVGMVAGLACSRFENGYAHTVTGRSAALFGCALAGAIVIGAVGQARALARTPEGPLAATRAWRKEIVDGLRWMRTNTEPSGPVRIAAARHEYGVLSAWGMGHLIEYYAQRPAIATNFGSFVSEDNFIDAAHALLARDPAQFHAELAALEARYVVVTPRLVGDIASQARMAGLKPAARQVLFERVNGRKTFSAAARETALWRLALDAPDAPASYPGLERVYASARRETVASNLSGPMISIWRVVGEGAPE